jgi:hypothetical protein
MLTGQRPRSNALSVRRNVRLTELTKWDPWIDPPPGLEFRKVHELCGLAASFAFGAQLSCKEGNLNMCIHLQPFASALSAPRTTAGHTPHNSL